MNIDDVGYGAGGGFVSGIIATIIAALGFKSRQDRQDKEMDILKKAVVFKDVFEQFEKRFDVAMEKIEKMDNKIDTLLTRRRDDRK